MFQQTKGKRILSIVLTLIIVFGMVQWNDLKVHATIPPDPDPTPTPIGQELIINGSADNGLNGWTFPEGSDGWYSNNAMSSLGKISPCDESTGTDKYFAFDSIDNYTYTLYQDVTITGLDSEITAGNILANFTMYTYAYAGGDTWDIIFNYYNDIGTNLGTSDQNITSTPTNMNTWVEKSFSTTVPATTKTIRVQINGDVSSSYMCGMDGISLKLSSNTPSVSINSATNIKENEALIYVNIGNLGNATEYGFCYSESQNPTIADNKKSTFDPSATYFNQQITDLSPNTTYYVRGYIKDSSATYYSDQISFTTLKKTPPTLSADASDNSVDNNIDITFPHDSDFEGKITGVTYNSVSLTENTDYTIGSGVITLKPSGGNSALTSAGTHSLEITATDYTTATVDQTITAGAVHDLTVTTQPAPGAVSGDEFATQPEVTLKDQYDNVCADGPSASLSITATANTASYTLGGIRVANAINGVATFTDMTCTTVSLGTGTITFTGGVTKESAPFNLPKFSGLTTTETPTIAVPCQLSSEYTKTIDLADVIKLNQTDIGDISYSDSAITNTANIIKAGSVNLSGSTLTFVLNPAIATGASSVIPIKVTTDNYTDITVNIQVSNTINRITPALSGTITTGNITYGDMLSAANLAATFINTSTSAVVPGTISWDSPNTIPNAGSYTANWTFTPTDTYTYQSITGTANVTVSKRAITLTPDHATFSKIYGEADPTITYQITQGALVGSDSLTTPLTYAGTNAGTYDIVANTALNTNYNITVANGTDAFIITKRPLAIYTIVINQKTYDGTVNMPSNLISAYFTGMAGSDSISYSVSATYVSADVGMRIAPSTVTLTGASDTNYSLTTNKIDAFGLITKATTTAVTPSPINVIAGQERSYSFDASTIALENVTAPKSTGSCSYSVEPATSNTNFSVQPYMSDTNTVSFTTASSNVASATPIGSFTVRVSSQNYNDILVPVNVIAVNKTTLTVSGVSITNKDYDGTAISPNGTPVFKDGTTEVSIASPVYHYISTDGAGYDSEQAPINAGEYKLTISVPDSNMDYTGSIDIPFTINKAPLTITANPQTITVGDAMPTAYSLTFTGFVSEESESTPGVFSVSPVASCPSGNSNTAASYPIIVNTPVASNYEITTANGTLTVQPKYADSSFYTVSKVPNENGWYKNGFTITPTGKDGFDKFRIVGIMGGLQDATFFGESANGSYNFSFEKGSAVTEPITFTFKQDSTAPVLSNITYNPAVSFIRDIYNFLTGSISISVQVSDNLSGVSTVNYELIPDTNGGTAKTGTATVTNGVATVSVDEDFVGMIRFSATDLAGNQAATITSNFATEDTAPDISIAGTGTESNGWYTSDVTLDTVVRDNAANAISGGIKQITYQCGSDTTDYVPSTIIYDYSKQYTITADGSYTYHVSAIDNSGNTSSKDITINIDKTAPIISTVQSVPIDATKLYKGYHLTIAATDATGSGIAGYSVDGGTSWQTGNEFTLNHSNNITASDIKVKDIAGNVATYAGSDISITVPKVTTVTTLALDSSNAINYGSSVNLTATVTKDPDYSQTIDGTISFYINNGSGYVKIGDSVLASDGKATYTVSKVIYQNIGAKSFYASYSGNSIFDSSNSNTETITVTPKTLTVKAEDITCFSGNTLPGTKITYSGFLEGENESNTSIGTVVKAVHAAMDTNTAGSYPIRVLVGTFATAPNYTITKVDGTLTIKNPSTDATMTGLVTTPVTGAPSAILTGGATLPPGINAGDVRLLVSALPPSERSAIMQASAGALQQIPRGNTLAYEISLIDVANGNAVVQPGGGINITLPYPNGTDSNTLFGIVHMIGGVTPETLAYTNTDKGISFVTQSLSPFIIGYNTNESTNNNSTPNTNNNSTPSTDNNSSPSTDNNNASNTTTAPSTATTAATVASAGEANKTASKSSSVTSLAEEETVQNEEAIQTEPDNTATVTDSADDTAGTVDKDSNNKDKASGDTVNVNKADSNSSLIFIIAAIAITAVALLVFFIFARRRKKEEDTEEQNKSDLK